MTDQVRVVIKAEDQGGQKAISDFSRGLEGAAVSAEKSATRQSASFAKVRAELEKANLAQRRADAALAKEREANSQKTVTALIDDARRLVSAQRKSALESAAVFVAAERQKATEVARIDQQSRQTLAQGLKQREADNARSIEIIRAQNDASRKAETAATLAEIRRRSAAQVAESVSAARAQRQISGQFTGNLSGRSAAESASVFSSAGLTGFERAERQRLGRSTTLAEDTLEESVARRRAARTDAFLQQAEARRGARAREFEEAARAARSSTAGAAGSFASGVGAAAGVGFGAGPLGAGIGTALAVGFSSLQAIEFERANAALTAVTGSSTEAGQALAFVRDQAERLGVSVTTLSLQYSRFEAAAKGTALEGGRTRDIFLAITEAGQRLNLRSEQVEGALNAVSQIISKGSVQAEELRGQLGDRLPGAFNIMARALGVTTRELDKMLRTGEVLAADALPKFAAELRRTFDTDANTRIETTISNFTRLGNEISIAAAALGNYINAAAGPAAGFIADRLAVNRRIAALPEEDRASFEQRIRSGRAASQSDFSSLEGELRAVEDRQRRFTEAAEAAIAERARLSDFQNAAKSGGGAGGAPNFEAGRRGPAVNETALRNSTRTLLEAQGKLNAQTELQIFLQREASGEFEKTSLKEVGVLRQIAIATDANNARLKAERDGKRELRQEDQARVRELKASVQAEEQAREESERGIRANLVRAETLREEIRLGRELSAVERARIAARIGRTSVAGQTVAGSEDAAAGAYRDARLDQNLRAFRLSGEQRAGDISFDTGNLNRNDLSARIATEQRQIELEARRLLVGATQEQTTAILEQADAQMALVEALITQQDLLSRDAVVGARRTLQQIERDSTNAATAISEAITQGFRSAEESASRFALTGKFSIRDFVSSALADLARLAAQRGISSLLSLAGNVALSYFGGGPSPGVPSNFTGGGFGSGNGLQVGTGRADGGSVFGGTVYPVVERGRPEAFRDARGDTYLIPPKQGGQVIPMNASGGGATQTVALTLNIDARGATDPVAIQRAAKAAQREIAGMLARKNSRGIVTAD